MFKSKSKTKKAVSKLSKKLNPKRASKHSPLGGVLLLIEHLLNKLGRATNPRAVKKAKKKVGKKLATVTPKRMRRR